MNPAELSRLWDEQWPEYPKVSYELRAIPDRWVRFHALPGSKRYPESEAEYAVVLARHNAILSSLIATRTVLVVAAGYSATASPHASLRPEGVDHLLLEAVHWSSVLIDAEPGSESWMHLYVSEILDAPHALSPLLRLVADHEIANVLIADPSLNWLYHPYDGGMDVLLPSTAKRDALRGQHRSWLSSHPSGL
ncbi:hypothetical protein GCM10009539_37030 [Cryptosporangium japonicum]|uniref:DUF3885 domain-containing protein n=1 Tax=Cryptosporangium japonicum TaxID=80872 RepID=A0ABN0UEX5_9ACTN